MFYTEEKSDLSNDFFSTFAQLKSLEKFLDKNKTLKDSYAKNVSDDYENGHVVKITTTTQETFPRGNGIYLITRRLNSTSR